MNASGRRTAVATRPGEASGPLGRGPPGAGPCGNVNAVYYLYVLSDQATERPNPRARRHDAALRRIVDEAMALVAAEGLDGLSMARLADAADYTPGALYRYVDSKDALLSLLVERVLADVRDSMAAALDGVPPGAPVIARVVALVDAYRAFAARQPHRFGLIALTMAEPRVLLVRHEHAAPAAAATIAALRPLFDALTDAAAAGELDAGPAVDRAVCVFALVQGLLPLVKLARVAPAALDVARLSEVGLRGLLLGWGAPPSVLEAALAARPPAPGGPS